MNITPVEIIGIGGKGPICRVQGENGKTFVCKIANSSSILHKIPLHRNILPLIHQEQQEEQWIQLYLDHQGIDVEQLLKRESPSQYGEAVLYALCSAIAHLHQEKYIHRDIKPSNIILTQKGNIYLIDLERTVDISHQHSLVMGNTPYLAPEVQQWRQYSYASDIFALGVLAKTIQDADPEHMMQEWVQWIEKCTHPQPTHRPSALEILASLSRPNSIQQWSARSIPLLCAERKHFFQSLPLPPSKTVSISPSKTSLSITTILICILFILSMGVWLYTPIKKTAPPLQSSSTFTLPTISNTTLPSPSKPVIPTIKTKTQTKQQKIASPSKKEEAVHSYRISSIPWGAKVWIDSQYQGKTLLKDIHLTMGTHLVTIEYQEKRTTLSLHFDGEISGWMWNSETEEWKALQGQ